jgi:hypothetical protein
MTPLFLPFSPLKIKWIFSFIILFHFW